MPREKGQIGVIEDDPVIGGTLVHRLELEGYAPYWWRTGAQAVDGLRTARPDLIVCDIRLPDMSGEDVFLKVLPLLGGTPFLFVTAFGQIEQAVRLTKAGAVDYIAKPYALLDLLQRIPRLIAQRPGSEGVLGTSEAMRRVEALLMRVADVDSSLLFIGESGVGKEVAARFIHRLSTRAGAPFMAVNCAAVPSELIESELFGHERGAFTGAQTRHHGYVERAREGTLFLDEVSELAIPVQAKLLRLLQERAFTRVGGEAAIKANARIMCASNSDLERAVADGRFRRDLYYRINVISVAIPPLRERSDDVLPLARFFLREFAESFNREIHGFTPEAEQALLAHDWPGNVRELRNRVERAVALAPAPWIGAGALFPEAHEQAESDGLLPSLAEIRDRAERQHIRAALSRTSGRVEDAAKLLGISRSTLFEKMRKLDIRSGANASSH
ncbi:MAG: sigma-54-dependent Fis family transcriptional regulator [Proteobacteria bacterium]|nr:sigma-54-dependent Fis family transcriptional regulator [Pseudomonadota bacterium]MBI3497029.1 sigma-54-dependent Fis family transcriptional regulator [Pseudomonadota bacterium]